MALLAVSAIGADRPGIVATVTRVLVQQGCNLEDTSMTILRGHFAMTLVVAGDGTAESLAEALAPAAEALDLIVTVRAIEPEPGAAAAHPYVVSVHGADHPGIVHAVAQLLADAGANITDLTTRLGDADGAYAMVIDVDLPDDADAAGLERELGTLAASLSVTATMHPADTDLL